MDSMLYTQSNGSIATADSCQRTCLPEVRNSLLAADRQGRQTEDEAVDLDSLKALPILTDQEADLDTAMRLALKHGLSFYDALYLELASRRRLPLATLDDCPEPAPPGPRVSTFLHPY